MTGLGGLLAGMAATNLFAFGLFGFDKARARARGRRVSERALLWATLLGGVGAWLGQQVFRHKTQKQPFGTWFALAIAAHLAGVGASFSLLR